MLSLMRKTAALLMSLALMAGGCAAPSTSSDTEWRRGQCGQIVDRDAREKCMERVDKEFVGR